MFLGGQTLPSLFSSLMLPASDDDFEEDSDDEDEEDEGATERLLIRGPRRRRRNRRRSGLTRHNIPWPSAEPRGFFPRQALFCSLLCTLMHSTGFPRILESP